MFIFTSYHNCYRCYSLNILNVWPTLNQGHDLVVEAVTCYFIHIAILVFNTVHPGCCIYITGPGCLVTVLFKWHSMLVTDLQLSLDTNFRTVYRCRIFCGVQQCPLKSLCPIPRLLQASFASRLTQCTTTTFSYWGHQSLSTASLLKLGAPVGENWTSAAATPTTASHFIPSELSWKRW